MNPNCRRRRAHNACEVVILLLFFLRGLTVNVVHAYPQVFTEGRQVRVALAGAGSGWGGGGSRTAAQTHAGFGFAGFLA